MKTSFQFRSNNFNISVPRDYFINPSCFGDDLAEWMIKKLNERGIETSPTPDQEDFGWYFTFIVDNVEHCLVVGFQPNDVELGGRWIGWVERKVGLFGSLFGGRNRHISPEAIVLVDAMLSSSAEIHGLTWHSRDSSQ
jgi:hypothetical protein